MRIALTGVSGFIGSEIARALVAAGHEVTGLVRASSRRDHIESFVSRFVVGDQDDRSAWPAFLEGADCVIHNSVDWKALKEDDPARHQRSNLLAALDLLHESAPRQFIFMSTVAVHHDMRPRWNGRIDEDHPLRPSTLYGAYKAAVEAHLWADHFANGRNTVAFRPCAVYGIDARLARSIGFPYIKSLRAGEAFDRKGGGKFVHVEDVAAAIVAAVGNPAAAGHAYNLVDCYARWSDLATMLADALGVDVTINESSPPAPKNEFTCDAAHELGVALDRGHEGIRAYFGALVEAAGSSPQRGDTT